MKKTFTNFHSRLSALFSTPLIPRRRGRLCLLLLCFLPFGAFAQVSVWDGTHTTWTNGVGTEAYPYLIENAAQLAHLAYYVNSGTGTVGSGKYWKLTINIDLNGLEWTPIGSNTSFGGHFDGGGHTIANMVVNANRAGLFGGKDGGSVKNIGIIGNSSIKGIYNAGGIVGTAGGTIIENCYNTGNVFSTTDYAGGIAGTAGGTIIDCYNTGSVSSTSSDQTSDHCAGGIVGKDAYTTITNCHNTGKISATNLSSV